MKPFTQRSLRLTAAVTAMILTLGAAPATLTGISGGLTVQGFTVQGSEVVVTVTNGSSGPLSGMVVVRALSSNGEIVGASPVTVPGRGRSTVCLGLTARVEGGVVVGVVLDDGAPF